MTMRHGLMRRFRAFAVDERATATMEFVIVFPIAMLLFIAVAETGMILTRQVLMERSLDEAVRVMRLAQNLTLTPDAIEDEICANTSAIPNCETVLIVDVQVLEPYEFEVPEEDPLCVDRNDMEIRPANTFEQGTDNEMVLIRICAVVDRLIPFSGYGLNLTRDESGGMHMVATSVFINEPD
jgi:hypothetical protein